MPAVIIDRESVAHRKQTPEVLYARYSIEADVPYRELYNARLRDVPSHPPFHHFHVRCVEGARRFVADMLKQRYEHELAHSLGDIRIAVPLPPVTYRMDEPLIANQRRTTGFRPGELIELLGFFEIEYAGFFVPKYVLDIEVPAERIPQQAQQEEA